LPKQHWAACVGVYNKFWFEINIVKMSLIILHPHIKSYFQLRQLKKLISFLLFYVICQALITKIMSLKWSKEIFFSVIIFNYIEEISRMSYGREHIDKAFFFGNYSKNLYSQKRSVLDNIIG
jgi:hypothetical protein